MKNFLHKTGCMSREVQVHVKPPSTTLIKSKIDMNLVKHYFKIKLCRNPTSEASDMYQFKMELFDHGEA